LTRELEDTIGTKTIAAALSGVFPGAFAGRPKPLREGSEETLPDLPEEAGAGRIIVVGDADFAGDAWSQNNGRNMSFLIQAADWLGNDDDIIGIRNRQSGVGRLDKITDADKRSRAMAFARTLNVVFVPLLVVAAMIVALRLRRSKVKGETTFRKENANAD
jgi:ABC-type uncharacterized transport system involved in gliding motility auxiliary subunit